MLPVTRRCWDPGGGCCSVREPQAPSARPASRPAAAFVIHDGRHGEDKDRFGAALAGAKHYLIGHLPSQPQAVPRFNGPAGSEVLAVRTGRAFTGHLRPVIINMTAQCAILIPYLQPPRPRAVPDGIGCKFVQADNHVGGAVRRHPSLADVGLRGPPQRGQRARVKRQIKGRRRSSLVAGHRVRRDDVTRARTGRFITLHQCITRLMWSRSADWDRISGPRSHDAHRPLRLTTEPMRSSAGHCPLRRHMRAGRTSAASARHRGRPGRSSRFAGLGRGKSAPVAALTWCRCD